MRKSLLLAAALALAPLSAAFAQQASAPAAAPKLVLTQEQQAELQQSVLRGRALAVLDQAARVSTKDMLARVPNPTEAGIVGWIAQPEGNGVTVTYYAKEGDGFAAVYKAQVLANRVSAPQVYAAGQRPALTGPSARMAAARAAVEALDHRPCGPDFNAIVMPPDGDAPVLVYQMSPRMVGNKLPLGGHFRTAVAADGSIAQTTPLGGACADLTLPAVTRGQRPRPPVVNARQSVLPSELHVFLSLWARRPIVVATGTDQIRLWGVTAESIAELQQ